MTQSQNNNNSSVDQRFQGLKKIGQGAYGIVYRATDIAKNSYCAIKEIELNDEDEGIPGTTIREIAFLQRLKHTNIVNLYDVVYSNNKLLLVFEYCDQDLTHYLNLLKQKNILCPLLNIKSFVYQLLQGIKYCHDRGVLHRDLKPQNLLINSDGTLKICDCGLARTFDIKTRVFRNDVVTLPYRAPEILLGSKTYSVQIDVWSIGCIFGEMLNFRILFPGKTEDDQLVKIISVLGIPYFNEIEKLSKYSKYKEKYFNNKKKFKKLSWNQVYLNYKDKLLFDLLEKLLTYDPTKRITIDDALKHKFFLDLYDQSNTNKKHTSKKN